MTTGCIFSIQRFCVDDGPGIRTCVYLKGCDMRCRWCHNPEGISPEKETSYIARLCEGCGNCAKVCSAHTFVAGVHRFDREKCDCGGEAARACATGALSVVGWDAVAGDVLADVRRDRRYFDRTGGGLTLTGGEPMTQAEFARELLESAKAEGINTCIETNGAARWEDYRDILPFVDLFCADYKLTDGEKHREMTGISNRRIIENIERLCGAGARVVLRCPIIPGINDTLDHFRAIADMTRELPLLGFEIMPYHALGVSKERRLGAGQQRAFTVPDERAPNDWRERIIALGGREWGRII